MAGREIRNAWRLLRVGQLGARFSACPICGPTLLLRLARDAIAVRCVRCRASGIHMSIVQVIRGLYPDLSELAVYEMSSRGPLFEYLKRRAGRLTCSEYFDDVAPGQWKGGVQCQDVERLALPGSMFDLCTSTEVFEHVPDDEQGFREIRRVVKPGGRFVFTVPLSDGPVTIPRAERVGGEVRHLLPAEYHGDAIRGQGRVLVYRDYGRDIVDRLARCGFARATIVDADDAQWWGLGRKVIVAET
jgi:SAM-dependent methyltransferase